MTAVSATLRGRRAAESIMVDIGRISRPGAPTFNATTGAYTPSTSVFHEGPCRLRQPTAVEANELFG